MIDDAPYNLVRMHSGRLRDGSEAENPLVTHCTATTVKSVRLEIDITTQLADNQLNLARVVVTIRIVTKLPATTFSPILFGRWNHDRIKTH